MTRFLSRLIPCRRHTGRHRRFSPHPSAFCLSSKLDAREKADRRRLHCRSLSENGACSRRIESNRLVEVSPRPRRRSCLYRIARSVQRSVKSESRSEKGGHLTPRDVRRPNITGTFDFGGGGSYLSLCSTDLSGAFARMSTGAADSGGTGSSGNKNLGVNCDASRSSSSYGGSSTVQPASFMDAAGIVSVSPSIHSLRTDAASPGRSIVAS